jgi:hypothetical protein
MSNAEKNAALAKVAKGATIDPAGNAKVRINKSVVHIRYCSPNANAPGKFKFNINPNTLPPITNFGCVGVLRSTI